jgi:xylan 1,4-beta-xylosidase
MRRFRSLAGCQHGRRSRIGFCLFAVLFVVVRTSPGQDQSFDVKIHVDASKSQGVLKPIWRFFGADEPNYAYLTNGRKLIGELGELRPGDVYFRAHNLLNSGDGTAALKWGSTGVYRESPSGEPIYDWTILDRIFDTYLKSGLHPYAEIGFMPEPMSTHPEPYRHHWNPKLRYDEIYTGWAYPPRDYKKWGELVFQWTKHCVEKYGREEVERWFWEVWNEPNISYWRGTPSEFLRLHDYAVHAVRRALPTARVGGADTAGSGGRFTRAFLEHVLHGTNYCTGRIGTPLDFISFHAKGSPSTVNGHVRMGIAAQLRTVRDGFRIVSSFPELKDKPIVLGEFDPEGCAACQGSSLDYRNGTMYASYTAASFSRLYELATRYQVNLEGALTWAFEFEDQPYFAGFRSLASNGIDKPVLNVFRMFSRMGATRVFCESDGTVPLETITKSGVRGKPDISALASRDANRVTVLVWHYHDDDVPGPTASVDLTLDGLPAASHAAVLRHFRVDEEHSNAFTAWKEMGSPRRPADAQYAQLEKAGRLEECREMENLKRKNGAATLKFELPRKAVSLLVLDWGGATK